MVNITPSNNNDDNLGFDPTKLPGCKIWLDASDLSTVSPTDYNNEVVVEGNFSPTNINGCASWYDSSDATTIYNTSAGPVTPVSQPTDIAGCALWLDAADGSTLFQTSGGSSAAAANDPIGSWLDKSGNSRNFIQNAAESRPTRSSTNGLSSVSFNGTSNWMRMASMSSFANRTTFLVFSRGSTVAALGGVLAYRTYSSSNSFAEILDSDAFFVVTAIPGNTTNLAIDDGNATGAGNVSVWGNGLSIPKATTNNTPFNFGTNPVSTIDQQAIVSVNTNQTASGGKMIVLGLEPAGATRFYGMNLCEVIIYNNELTNSQRARVEKYLANKWGISNVHTLASSGGQIGYWGDKSGNNRHATQTVADWRPSYSGTVNGLSAITFDGTDDHFKIGDLSSAFPSFGEVFVVFEPNGPSYDLYFTSGNYSMFRYAGASYFGAFTSVRTNNIASGNTVAAPTSGVHVTSMRTYSSGVTYVRLDGVQWTGQGGVGYSGGSTHSIGFSNQGTGIGTGGITMNGKILEVITYNTDIGTANRAKVEQYLAKKWGISQNLHARTGGRKNVGYWKNKSSDSSWNSSVNDSALIQQNIYRRPVLGSINGVPAVEFSTPFNYLLNNLTNFNNTTNFSVFYVVHITNSSAFELFRLGSMSTAGIISRRYNGSTLSIAFGGFVGLNDSKPRTIGIPFVESIIKSAGNIHTSTECYRNNVAVQGAGYGTNQTSSIIGGTSVLGSYWGDAANDNTTNIVIGEFIVYERNLSTAERNIVETYLYDKWKIDKTYSNISAPTDISRCSLWLDASDEKTIFQNPNATSQVTADGQSVGYWADKAGGQDVLQSTSAARPTYKSSILNGRSMLYFDGGDDLLSQVTRTQIPQRTLIVVCLITSNSGDISALISFGDATGGLGSPGIAYSTAGVVWSDGAGSATTNSSNSNSSIIGKPSIVTSIYTQASTTNSFMYLNGVMEEYFTGTGVAWSSSGNRVQIGARTGGGQSSRRMVGYLGECIVYDKVLSDSERASVERYLSKKWGINKTIAPNNLGSLIKLHDIKVSNKDAQNWIDRVFQNGGTVSENTADLVNSFCNQIDAAGLRKKFYRLNLFCGNDLNACLTPLYLGPTSDTSYGFKSENNTAFVGSDYSENSGLTCNAHAKALLTGINPSDIGCDLSGHLSFYQTQYNSDTNPMVNNGYVMGAGTSDSFKYFINIAATDAQSAYSSGADVTQTPYFGGLYLVSRENNSSLFSMEQSLLLSQKTNSTTTGSGSSTLIIFNASTIGSSFNNTAFAHLGSLKGYSVGQSMTTSQAAAFSSIMEAFQSGLGRGLPSRASSQSQFAAITNPDAKSWIDAVYANGGTVSPSTALAVNNFCNSADNTGLRSRFYRLNLFCGDNLNACLVPLYRGPSRLGIRYGNAKDLNTPFGGYTNSDDFNYVENQGLLGNTQDISGTSFISRRLLNTGFITGSVSALNNNMHVSAYSKVLSSGGYAMGSYDGAGMGFSLQIGVQGYNLGAFANSLLNITNTSTSTVYPSDKGLYVGNYSNNVLTMYEGRASTIGQRDLTTIYALSPTTTSAMGIFSEWRGGLGLGLFNYLDRLQGYSIGTSMSSSDVQSYYDMMQTFQTSLSRANEDPVLGSQFSSITNLDARDWLTRVYKNGGSVSVGTATAVQNFCNSVDNAGLRDRFFRLNLFCGNDLNSCTVPLYRGPTRTGTQWGFLYDVNSNINSSDYNESGTLAGIKGNGTNKYLNTGLGTNFTDTASLSFGAFVTEPTSTAFSAYLGVFQSNNNTNGTILYYRDRFTRGLDGVTSYPPAPTDSIISGHHVYSRTGSSTFFQAWNGVSGTSASSASSSRGTTPFMIHTANNNGTPVNYGNGRISMYHIGLGLTTQQATSFYNIVQQFNSEMNRTRPSDSFTLSDAEAKVWVDNVYINGGSVSATVASAVDTLCTSLNSAGIRSKIYRLNLFCGDNLNSVMVPLFRGPDRTGIFGNLVDLNNNFIADDYEEATGLIGNGSNKTLDTGLPQNFAADRHIGVVPYANGTTAFRYLAGARSSGFAALTAMYISSPVTRVGLYNYNDAGNTAGGGGVADIVSRRLAISVSDASNPLTGGRTYSNAVGGATGAANSVNNATTIAIFAIKQDGGTFDSPSNARITGYTIGRAMTATQVETYNGIWTELLTALGRG